MPPRIVWNEGARSAPGSGPIEVHYGSPHEFVTDFAENGEDAVFLPTDRVLETGALREIVLHIGFIARSFRLRGEVTESVSVPEARRSGRAPGVRFRLAGADGAPSSDLAKVLQQLQQGLAYEAARVIDGAAGERLPREKQIRSMPTTLKIMLALRAEREDRLVLATDPDPQVIQFLLKNGRITLAEVRTLSARTSLTYAHITTIAANAAWIADDQVKLNLARNPHLPDTLVESILGSLNTNQLKVVAASASSSGRARRVAHRILHGRGA